MVNRGTIDLEKKVNDYVNLNSRIRYPIIEDLLTHTSGYHAFIPLFSSIWVLISKGFNKKNIYQNLNEDWLYQSLKKIRPLRKRKYRYSDYNYAVLALIIQTIEQRPYKQVIIDYIQSEIGMTNTFYGSEAQTKNHKYSWLWEDNNPFLASGGLFSTIEDMLLFLNFQLQNQERLNISHAKYHRTNINRDVYTGFSWNSFYKGKFYWHIGGQGYYRSYVLFDLKKEISIVILSTVDVDIQHVSRLGSSLYRNAKRNPASLQNFFEIYKGLTT